MTGNPKQKAHAGSFGASHVGDHETGPAGGNHRARTAFGLDLAGYSSGRSSLVRASRDVEGKVKATVYRGHAFSKKPARGKPLDPIVQQEARLLAACLRHASLYADVPIDLQRLPCPGRETYAWQLVKRPVDFAFEALPPLADRIGSVVARFRNVLRFHLEDHTDPLGRNLYETYPAGSLRLMGLPHKGYKDKKNRITFEAGSWAGSGPKGEVLACIASGLRMTGAADQYLTHDELDAVICALTGVVDDICLCHGKRLETTISRHIDDGQVEPAPPRAYVLMRRLPERLSVAVSVEPVRNQAEMLEKIAEK